MMRTNGTEDERIRLEKVAETKKQVDGNPNNGNAASKDLIGTKGSEATDTDTGENDNDKNLETTETKEATEMNTGTTGVDTEMTKKENNGHFTIGGIGTERQTRTEDSTEMDIVMDDAHNETREPLVTTDCDD